MDTTEGEADTNGMDMMMAKGGEEMAAKDDGTAIQAAIEKGVKGIEARPDKSTNRYCCVWLKSMKFRQQKKL
jgi:hypothetical protein